MRVVSCHVNAMLLAAWAGAMIGCAASGPEVVAPVPAQGVVSANLVGQGPSGAIYRLRDAIITVEGPVSTTVWNTEDDPDRTSLSANVVTGDYSALLHDGWRLERVVGGSTIPATAVLTSDNPARFTVVAQQRTTVPLSFRVDTEVVDLTQGYDIVLDIDEEPLPQLAVVNADTPRGIDVFAARDSGDVAPRRSITGPSSTLVEPISVSLDRGQLIVTDHSARSVDVFSVAPGDVAPVRRIIGPSTTLDGPVGAVAYNGELYVMDGNGILKVFPLAASGNVAPTRTITGFPGPGAFVISRGEIYITGFSPPFIRVFSATASGNVAPIRFLNLTSSVGTICAGSIAIRDDEIFVGDVCSRAIRVYLQSASGNVDPIRTLAGPATGIESPGGIITFGDELFLVDPGSFSVRVFPRRADGNIAPSRVLSGPTTGLTLPANVAIF